MPRLPKQGRADSQISGLAGECFVAAELLKRGLQAALTMGNAKAVDLFAQNPATGTRFTVQVKALRAPNYFPIAAGRVEAQHVYVFVLLNPPGKPPEYFIVPGTDLVNDPKRFGRWFRDPKFPGIGLRQLRPYQDNWGVFDS